MAIPQVFLFALFSLVVMEQALVLATFDTDTACVWGKDNCQINGDNLALILNQWSGASVKGTKEFLFGYVNMRIKLVPDDSAAVVTTYYISSPWDSEENDWHDEIDFEFLGNVTGEPYTIHTNIFVNGVGNREEQFKPWFDPTSDYHSYTIFWTPYIVQWSIDGVVFRVFKNNEDKGIPFPKTRAMTVYSSIWNADDWACQGGRIKTNWTYQPFTARYLNYEDSVCVWTGSNNIQDCSAETAENWYTAPEFRQPTQSQIDSMNDIRSNYMIYNYCTDTKRFNGAMPQECYLPPY
jgi:xyloglucan:xyloglucosyl transferase